MIQYLFNIFLSYLLVYFFFIYLRQFKQFKKLIFCSVCFTFFSIFLVVLTYYLFEGVELLPIAYLLGCSVTGSATDLTIMSNRNRKEKESIKDKPYSSNLKEIFYQNRFFLIELTLFLIGLFFLKLL